MSNVRHIKKFADGKMTPKEMWRSMAGRPCYVCPQPGAIQIITRMLLKDMMRDNPEVIAQIMAKTGGKVPVMQTTYGPMLIISEIWACDSHKRDAEIAAARAPDKFLVEINRGPPDIKAQVSVPN